MSTLTLKFLQPPKLGPNPRAPTPLLTAPPFPINLIPLRTHIPPNRHLYDIGSICNLCVATAAPKNVEPGGGFLLYFRQSQKYLTFLSFSSLVAS